MKKYFLVIFVLFVAFTLAAQEEEKLTPEEADELIAKYAQEEQELKTQLDELMAEVEELRVRYESLNADCDDCLSRLAELEEKLEEMSWYVVQPGDWLAKIASKVYGRGNEHRWADIYNANKAKIKDPDLLRPGLKLYIPRP
jgi:nucleoid-associated protein YgaU